MRWKTATGRRPALWFLLAAAVAAGACNTYYIPPPPVAVVLTNYTPSLVISSLDVSGAVVPSSIQLNGAVENSSNPTLLYSVGQDGNYVQGGNNIWGYVTNSGVYTAPLQVPTPNTVTILARAQADPTQTASTTITLLNPTATTTSVTPNVLTQGLSYTLDIAGENFAPGATVNLSGATLGPVQYVSSSELKMTAQMESAGLVSLSVINPYPFGPTNTIAMRSQPTSPATASAIAVEVAQALGTGGQVTTATKAYVPRPDSLAVVNLDTNKQIGSVVMPNGYVPNMAAAHPAKNEVVVASEASNIVQIVDANHDQIAESLSVPVTGTTTVDGTACTICAMIVDSARDEAILDTAAGYLTLNLDTGAASAPLAAPAAANFAYDPVTQRIYAPYHNPNGSGVNVIDLAAGTVEMAEPQNVSYGTGTDTATYDQQTGVLTVGDADTGTYLDLNFNNGLSSNGNVQTPAAPFTISSACAGTWKGMDLDFTSHTGWVANLGECVAAIAMPPSAPQGTPGDPSPIRWARMPLGPDGLPWQNTPLGQPQTLAVFTGSDGEAYGLAERSDGTLLLKMNLQMLQNANAITGALDANQVDPTNVTVNGQQESAITYIALHG
jgi:hypothetical protein